MMTSNLMDQAGATTGEAVARDGEREEQRRMIAYTPTHTHFTICVILCFVNLPKPLRVFFCIVMTIYD